MADSDIRREAGTVPASEVNRWFHVHVHAECKANGWSNRELARRAGCSVSTFTRLKEGDGIALAIAARVADALGKPLSDLLVPVSCGTCRDLPPQGFTCRKCGTDG